MPTTKTTMQQIRQVLGLHLEADLSFALVACAVGIGKGTVGKFMLLARAAGVGLGAVTRTLSDGAGRLQARLEGHLCARVQAFIGVRWKAVVGPLPPIDGRE